MFHLIQIETWFETCSKMKRVLLKHVSNAETRMTSVSIENMFQLETDVQIYNINTKHVLKVEQLDVSN